MKTTEGNLTERVVMWSHPHLGSFFIKVCLKLFVLRFHLNFLNKRFFFSLIFLFCCFFLLFYFVLFCFGCSWSASCNRSNYLLAECWFLFLTFVCPTKNKNTLSHESATIMSSSKLKPSTWYLLTRTTYSGKYFSR